MTKKIAAFLMIVSLAVFMAAPAQTARISDAESVSAARGEDAQAEVTIDFREVDIRVVAKFISEITGKNFIFDKQVRDKVTVFSPTKVTPEEAYRLFESVLEVHGYTTVPTDGVIKVVPSQKARNMAVETRRVLPPVDVSPEDRVVTQLIRLQYADAGEIKTLLGPLMDKTGVILSYDSGNTIIVTDYASNIDRMANIVRAVDVKDEGSQLTIIPLQYASARDTAAELEEILKAPAVQGKRQTSAPMSYKVVPDERTNHLIVMARTAEVQTIRELVAKLDVAAPRGSDRVHVYFLKNAVAEDLAQVLNDLTSAKGVAPSAGPAAASAAAQTRGGSPTRLLLQEEVFITADKATNSLIIRAERQDFLVLKDIIDKLDIQRAQVLVEAIIMEVSMKKALDLGAEWRVLNFEGDALSVIGGTNMPDSTGTGLINKMATNPFAGPSGLILGAVEGTLSYGGKTYLNIGALIQALQQDTDVNILSTPHLLTMDNEEARIVVGEERPFLKSSMTSDTGATNPTVTRTYDYKDLGLTLKLTPHITQGEYVKLSIFQQILNYLNETETGAISSTKRETETTVQVRDRETVVIGGLIREDARQGKNQVPCLGNIPVLGWAFKRQADSTDKTNLLVLITPTIIRTADQLREVTERKKTETEQSTQPPQPDDGKTAPDASGQEGN